MFRVKVEREANANLRTHYLNLKETYPGSDYPDEWFYGIRNAITGLVSSAKEEL